ncbi:SMR family transporter [Paenibacillus sedimenti]|uniref:SMR family transporter n=1 Tax=Paenibacillus sedimenti TaxID=2770274 RepID=UPI001CB71C8E
MFQSFAVLLGKYAANSISEFSLSSFFINYFYMLSIICLMFQSIFWNKTLKSMPLSVAYPFTGIVYFFIIFYSWYFFHESIKINNFFGVCIIMIGLYFLGKENSQVKSSEKQV